MSKDLKKVLMTGAAFLMFAGVGASANGINVHARHVHTNKVTKVNHKQFNKSIKKHQQIHRFRNVKKNQRVHKVNNKRKSRKNHRHSNKRTKRNASNKKIAKHLNKKAYRKSHQNKRVKRSGRILKSRYRRTNNHHLLDNSGFVNLNKLTPGNPEIVSHYAPNNRKALVPKKLNVNKYIWLQGNFPQQNLRMYQYISSRHGWVNFANNL